MRTEKLHAGTDFPALTVTAQDGSQVDISKPTGDADWQMVTVYRGRHCPMCTKFLNSLAGFRQRLLDIGVDIAAVSGDSKEQLEEHLSRLDVNFPLHYGLSQEQMGLLSSLPGLQEADIATYSFDYELGSE